MSGWRKIIIEEETELEKYRKVRKKPVPPSRRHTDKKDKKKYDDKNKED